MPTPFMPISSAVEPIAEARRADSWTAAHHTKPVGCVRRRSGGAWRDAEGHQPRCPTGPFGGVGSADGLAVDGVDPIAGKAGATSLTTVNSPVERLSAHK